MSSRRTLILVGAIALGLIAALLLFNYVRGIEDRANNNAKRVDVYVAKTDIPKGTEGAMAASSNAVGVAQIPQEFRPASAITTTDEIQKKVALFDIPQNTPIVQDMFVDPAQAQISFRERLKNPEHVAITVSTDEVHGVAGFLVPGDEVNLMVTPTSEAEGGGFAVSARYLFQKVQILAVGQSTLLSPGEQVQETSAGTTAPPAGNSGLITFNVPPEAAQWIASAQEQGGLYMTLVAEDYIPKPLPEIQSTGTLPGESGELTPYGPNGNED